MEGHVALALFLTKIRLRKGQELESILATFTKITDEEKDIIRGEINK